LAANGGAAIGAVMIIDPSNPETVYSESSRVACEGEGGALGHPRVWLQMGAEGFVDCGYCDRRFILVDGPGDTRKRAAGRDGEEPGQPVTP
jgi:uncharacterized Zn-finger protein